MTRGQGWFDRLRGPEQCANVDWWWLGVFIQTYEATSAHPGGDGFEVKMTDGRLRTSIRGPGGCSELVGGNEDNRQ
jgi:hypothetical protein